MKRWVLFLGLLLSAGACSEQAEKPDDVIDENKMVSILAHIQVVEALHQRSMALPEGMEVDSVMDTLYAATFRNHEVTADQFRRSYTYYESEPEKLAEMYDQVLTILLERQAQIQRED